MNYFKILVFLQKGDKGYFDIPVSRQKEILIAMPEPRNNIDRGYQQYVCQNILVAKWKEAAFNIMAAFIFPFITILYWIKGIGTKKGNHYDAMIERKGMDEVIPDAVKEKYHPVSDGWYQRTSLSTKDLGFLLKLAIRAPHHPYFVLKAMINIANYSDMIRAHSPKVMIQFGEFSFSSSILTEYCHSKGIKHVDVMHGEKFYFIRDAFFMYDECFVWDKHYINLFKRLRADAGEFIVALPQSMHIDCKNYVKKETFSDYKYYLQEYTEAEIKSIVESMQFANREGKSVKYRPHPRYSDIALLRKYVSEDQIEIPKAVSIMESISNLGCAVGSFTTVLTQAFFSGKCVVLDDVTFADQYGKLKEMEFILATEKTGKLSEFQQ